jgi:hypothetical protein
MSRNGRTKNHKHKLDSSMPSWKIYLITCDDFDRKMLVGSGRFDDVDTLHVETYQLCELLLFRYYRL